MRLDCRMDISDVIKQYAESGQIRQANWGVVVALNNMALKIQEKVRSRITSAFSPRHSSWVLRQIKLTKVNRATKQSWKVTILVDWPELSKFEVGEPTLPMSGRATLAAKAGTLTNKIIRGDNSLAIRNLGFGSGTILPGMKGNTVNTSGTSAAFAIKSQAGNTVILQRSGKGKGKNKILYHMTSRITRPPKLRFFATAQNTIDADYREVFVSALAQVMKTARK